MEIGIDIVELDRIDISKEHFIKRVLSDPEYNIFCTYKSNERKREYVASRFAVKEAYLKAHHKGLGDIDFKDIVVLNDSSGAPYIESSNAKVSISHEKHYAVAVVLIENT